METIEEQKVMIAKCTICGCVFHVCIEPYCYSEKNWLKSLKQYAKQPWIKIEVVPLGSFELYEPPVGQCCKKGIIPANV